MKTIKTITVIWAIVVVLLLVGTLADVAKAAPNSGSGGSGGVGTSSDTEVIYNDGGTKSGDSGMKYVADTDTLSVGKLTTLSVDTENELTLGANTSYNCGTRAPSANQVNLVAEAGVAKLCTSAGVEVAVGARRGVRAETTATPYDIGLNAARTELEAYNGYYHICNNAGSACAFTMPAPVASATATMHICFGTMTSGGFNVDMDDGVDLVRGGAICTAGVSVNSPGTEGSTACFIAVNGDTWYLDESKGNFICGS